MYHISAILMEMSYVCNMHLYLHICNVRNSLSHQIANFLFTEIVLVALLIVLEIVLVVLLIVLVVLLAIL